MTTDDQTLLIILTGCERLLTVEIDTLLLFPSKLIKTFSARIKRGSRSLEDFVTGQLTVSKL